MERFNEYAVKLFHFAKTPDELNVRNARYDGMLTYARFIWKDAMRSPTLYHTRCDNPFVAFGFLILFLRILVWVACTVVMGLENEQLKGMDSKYVGVHHLGFPIRPNQTAYAFITVYVWGTAFLFFTRCRCCSECDKSLAYDEPIKWWWRPVWFAYDMALPMSFSGLFIYLLLHKNTFPEGSAARKEYDRIAELTQGSYIVNFIIMTLDMIFGRMVLIPAHIYNYIAFVIFYTFLLIAYTYPVPVAFMEGVAVVLRTWFMTFGCYVILSNLTYMRTYASNTSPFPLQDVNPVTMGLSSSSSDQGNNKGDAENANGS